MKYLITGGCGFLGSNLAYYLLERNEDVFIIDNMYREGTYKNLEWLKLKNKFDFFHCDIRNYHDVEYIIRNIRPDVIFHLSGQVAMTTSLNNPRFDFETNVIGTNNVLEALRKFTPDTIIVFSSTNKVYGSLDYLEYTETETRYVPKNYLNGFDESLKLDFHTPYGCSKGSADQYFLDYSRVYGLKTVVFRHSSIFGYRQFSTYDQGWVGWFIKESLKIRNSKKKVGKITISGNGKQVRDILFSDDLINCYMLSVNHINKTKGNAYNIGGGIQNSLSIIELFRFLESELDIKIEIEYKDWRFSDQKFFVANYLKAKNHFNWEPKISKFDGIRKMINWIELNYN